MAPRQNGLPTRPLVALGVPVFMAAHVAAQPMALHPHSHLHPHPQAGAAFGGGGFLQRVRNAFQQISQFPQQLNQLAHQAGQCQQNLLQQALDTARLASQALHSGGPPMVLIPRPQVPMQHVHEPMVLTPRPSVQHAAQGFGTQAQSFNPASLGQQAGQLTLQAFQRVQDSLALVRQSLALVVDGQRMGAGAAPAGVSPGGGPGAARRE